MARKYDAKYYTYRQNLRKTIQQKLIPSHIYTKTYTQSNPLPVLRFHIRSIDEIITLYKNAIIIREITALIEEAIKEYTTTILGHNELKTYLENTSRSITNLFNQVIKNDNIQAIIIGWHGGTTPPNKIEARKLKPLKTIKIEDYTEKRTLEIGTDIILKQTPTVRKLLRPLKHTKIYWTKITY